MKVYFYTLGCKVNQYETQAISESLQKEGYEITVSVDDADIYIINSCTVTAVSDQKTRQAVRRFKRNNPDCTVVLTGCMPQAYPDKAKELLSADIVIGNKNNSLLPEMLNDYFKNKQRLIKLEKHENAEDFGKLSISSFNEHTRAFIKIQDGCNRFCSYCIIPTARGRCRSKPLETIKEELIAVEKAGFKEVVLVGINLSAYGTDIDSSFCKAVELACSFDGIERVRLGSLEPDHITDEVIERLSELPKLCPQFHISLQSGCDETLKRMNRHYTAEEYRNLCSKLRESFEDTTLTTDVMVGFPLESDEEFEKSLQFVKEIKFEKVHVFPYSKREGTKAAAIPEQVSKAIKEKRCKIMIEETDKIREEFLQSQIGKTAELLCETNSDGFVYGYTKNYIPIKLKSHEDLQGQIKTVMITNSDENYCIAEITE